MKVFKYQSYSPDLPLCHFYLFPEVKCAFKVIKFQTFQAVKETPPGVMKEIIEKYFQPYFTKKSLHGAF